MAFEPMSLQRLGLKPFRCFGWRFIGYFTWLGSEALLGFTRRLVLVQFVQLGRDIDAAAAGSVVHAYVNDRTLG